MRDVALILLILINIQVNAQDLRLNELMAQNDAFFAPDGDKYSWLELHYSGSDTELNRYSIGLDSTGPFYPLPDVGISSPGHTVVWFSGTVQNGDSANIYLPLLLDSQTSAVFLLDMLENKIIDQIDLITSPRPGESIGRYPDGQGEFIHFATAQVSPYSANPDPGEWIKVTNHAGFSPRDSSPNASVVHNDTIWVLAGYRYVPDEQEWISKSDVWKSGDGVHWELLNESPPYYPYCGFVSFQGRIWAFGEETYSSADGINWRLEEVDTKFTPITRFTMFKDEIWAIKDNIVYHSIDGLHWDILNNKAPWLARDLPGFVAFRNKLWFFGGGRNYLTGSDSYLQDVWSSDDGINWTLVTDSAPWSGRIWFNYNVFDNKLWIMGGWNFYQMNDNYYGNKNDIWVSEDGLNWTEHTPRAPWEHRHASFSFIFKNALWISSGYGHGGLANMYNDLWKFSTHTYYSRESSITNLASWSSNQDGSGTNPPNFTENNQHFYLTGSSSLDKNLEISGTRSKLILVEGSSLSIPPNNYFSGEVELCSHSHLNIASASDLSLTRIDPESTVQYDMIQENIPITPTEFGTLIIKNANLVSFRSSTVEVKGNMELSNTSLSVSSQPVIKWKLHNNLILDESSALQHDSLDVFFIGNSTQEIKSANEIILNSITLDKAKGDLVSHAPLSMEKIHFIKGNIDQEDFTLNSKSFTGFSQKAYIKTTTKSTVRTVLKNTLVTIPLGTDTSYNEVSVLKKIPDEKYIAVYTALKNTNSSDENLVNVWWDIKTIPEVTHDFYIDLSWTDKNLLQADDDEFFYVTGVSDTSVVPCNTVIKKALSNVGIYTFSNHRDYLPNTFAIKRYKHTICDSLQYQDFIITYGDTVQMPQTGEPNTKVISQDTSVIKVENNQLIATAAGSTYMFLEKGAVKKDSFLITVLKKRILISVDTLIRPYGEFNPSPQLKYNILLNPEDLKTITSIVNYTIEADKFSPPGYYTINLTGGVHSTYDLQITDGVLQILDPNPAEKLIIETIQEILEHNSVINLNTALKKITITKTYGDTLFIPTDTGARHALIYSSTNPQVLRVDEDSVRIIGAGTAYIILESLSSENENLARDSIEIIVLKKLLAVKIDDACKNFGEIDPKIQVSYHGFVNGDTEVVLDRQPIPKINAERFSAPGTYDVIFLEGEDNNYQFNYFNGMLTILPTAFAPNEPFPNPGTGIFYLFFESPLENFSLLIINTSGTRIREEHVAGPVTSLMIDLTDQSKGIYILTIKNSTIEITRLLILK